jgi:hypothetical protein
VWTKNPDRILAVGPHFKQDTDARIRARISRRRPGWDDLEERAQNAWKPVRLDGNGIADSISTCIHPHQASGGAKIRSFNALTRDGNHRSRIRRVRSRRSRRRVRSGRNEQHCRSHNRGESHGTILPSWMRM